MGKGVRIVDMQRVECRDYSAVPNKETSWCPPTTGKGMCIPGRASDTSVLSSLPLWPLALSCFLRLALAAACVCCAVESCCACCCIWTLAGCCVAACEVRYATSAGDGVRLVTSQRRVCCVSGPLETARLNRNSKAALRTSCRTYSAHHRMASQTALAARCSTYLSGEDVRTAAGHGAIGNPHLYAGNTVVAAVTRSRMHWWTSQMMPQTATGHESMRCASAAVLTCSIMPLGAA